MEQMREVLSEDPAEPSDTDSPVGVIASTIAALVQSAGEIAIHTGSAHRQAWENSILRQFEALGSRWTSHIFRAPATMAQGSPDILSLLARQMNQARCISLILEYPGGIVTERSEGLSLALRRILSDPATALGVERELHRQAVARGISEEVYRNVVGMLMPEITKLARTDGMWRLLDGGEESLRTEDPTLELADLTETTSGYALRRSRACMLLDLLDEEMNASQYGSVIKVTLETAGECLRDGDSELLISILERLQRETQEESGRSSGRRAIATSALTRSAARTMVSTLVRELGRSPGEKRTRLMGLLGSLGEDGMAALLALARRTHDADSAEALRVLVRQDRPAFAHVRQLLSELPLADLPAALRVLLSTEDAAARAQLSALISRPEPEARMALVRALDETRRGAGAEATIRLLSDPEPAVRVAAADVLGRLRVADAVPALCYVLGRESDFGQGARVKAAAARALGEIRSPEALPSLCEMLFSGGLASVFASKHPKIAAAEAVGKIGTVEARQAMEEWRRCRYESVREACRRALREMRAGPSPGVPIGGSDGG
jgi:hypothetical protein